MQVPFAGLESFDWSCVTAVFNALKDGQLVEPGPRWVRYTQLQTLRQIRRRPA